MMNAVEMLIMMAAWLIGAGGFVAVLLSDWQPDPETVAALLFLTIQTVALLKLHTLIKSRRRE